MSIFPKFFFTLFGDTLKLPDLIRSYIERVEGDSGNIVDVGHTKEVYLDLLDNFDDLRLANSCDAGKATVLYSFYVSKYPLYVSYIERILNDGGTVERHAEVYNVYNDLEGASVDEDASLWLSASAGKATVLYAMSVSKYTLYVDYIERILDDGGTVVRQAEVYNTYDDLDSASVLADAFLWLSASAGKATVLYSMDANTIVYDHEQRVTADSGTTYLPGANARIVQQLIREDLYNDPSIIIPCASGKATVLYSLIPN